MAQSRAAKPLTLGAWKHAAVQEVVLQSGAGVVKQRPGTLAQAIRGGRVPNPLLPLAIRIEYEGVKAGDLDPEELAAYEDFRDWYISETVEEPALTPADVAELPACDRDQLWLNALHMFDGRISKVLESLEKLAPFRDGAGGPPAPADGAGHGGAAE